MKDYRQDMSRRVLSAGRDPKDVKVLFLVHPVVGENTGEARAKAERLLAPTDANIEWKLSVMSYLSGFDFGQFDLDAP
jgi:alkanesulfonate monooxygenase SsuD/methylene tetrahydromethanopterin reductase-like flavin-dependent oxidoreductase (luciferase family)